MKEIAAKNKSRGANHIQHTHLLRSVDVYCIAQIVIYTVLAVIFSSQLPDYPRLITTNILLCAGIVGINYAIRRNGNFVFWSLRNLALPGLILLLFLQVFHYIAPMHHRDYDAELIAADFAVFGVNPTYFIDAYAFPLLTEILQIAYVLYFFHPIAQGVELYAKRRYDELNVLMRHITFAFLLSYLAYFFIPAIGPRFTLHNYMATNTDLPGLWLTDAIRLFIDSGDNVALGSANPAATVHRNCMPSGHTMISVVNLIMAFRFRVKMRFVLATLTVLLVISTVYLRYHYAVDVMAGLILAKVTLIVEPRIYRMMKKMGFCDDALPVNIARRSANF